MTRYGRWLRVERARLDAAAGKLIALGPDVVNVDQVAHIHPGTWGGTIFVFTQSTATVGPAGLLVTDDFEEVCVKLMLAEGLGLTLEQALAMSNE